MGKELITLNKGTLQFIIASALGYGWNEASRYKTALKHPMEAWDNNEAEKEHLMKFAKKSAHSITTLK